MFFEEKIYHALFNVKKRKSVYTAQMYINKYQKA